MLNLAQKSSGARRAQGTNWLGVGVDGYPDSDDLVCPKVRNLGCGGVVAVMVSSQI